MVQRVRKDGNAAGAGRLTGEALLQVPNFAVLDRVYPGLDA